MMAALLKNDCGMKEPYNDIRMWDYKALPAVFGGDNVEVRC